MVEKTWKAKYLPWYRIIESVFGDEVPRLSEKEIEDYVSNKDWIIIPVAGERNKEDAKTAQRPNLYFDLSEDDKIYVGVTYDKIESVRRLREIISPFNEKYRTDILQRLSALDDIFFTKVFRKIKRNYWGESPDYEEVLAEQSNQMDLFKFVDVFKAVDKIMDERDILEKGKKYQLAPAINLIDTTVARDEKSFRKTLAQIKPVYEIAVEVKTEEEFKEEVHKQKSSTIKKRQEEFAKYVEDLKQKGIRGEKYREKIAQWQREHKHS